MGTEQPNITRIAPSHDRPPSSGRYSGVWALLIVLYVLCANPTWATTCMGGSGAGAITACEQELVSNPGNDDLRLRYAEALMDQRQYQRAADVLGEGLRKHPGNDALKAKYQVASSLAEEQKVIKDLPVKTPAVGTKKGVNEILCRTLKGQRALEACTNLLKTDPKNLTALTRQGDELMAANRNEDAAASYRLAVGLDPGNQTLRAKLQDVESKSPVQRPVQVAKAPPPAPQTPAASTAIASIANVSPPPPKSAQPSEAREQTEPVERFANAPLSHGVTY